MAQTAFDVASFRVSHPALCDPTSVHVPGLGSPPPRDGAVPFGGDLSGFEGVPKDPTAVSGMLKQGVESCGHYVSFRLPDPWGIFLRRGAVVALKEEYDRIIMRDLKGYAEPAPGYEGPAVRTLIDRIEYSLVLDFLVTHLRFHYAVDLAAAEVEVQEGSAKYAPYQEAYLAEVASPPKDPRAIGVLEECLANFEAFRNFMNPGYTDAIAKIIEGALEERNSSEWKAFFIGGKWGVEIANALSRQPPGYRDVTKLCMRRTSVGSTNYVRVMYMPDPQLRDDRLKELSARIAGRPVDGNLIPEAVPDPPMYLV